MRQLALSVVVVLGMGSGGFAQDSSLRGVYGPGESGLGQSAVGQRGGGQQRGVGQRAAAPTLSGVYGPGESGLGQPPALPPASGIYGPNENAPPPLPTASAPSYGSTSYGPSVLVPGQYVNPGLYGPAVLAPGAVGIGQSVPLYVNPTPMDDRPGYGTVIVNGRRAIVNQSTNQIVQFLD
jgi:hypothetical protein